MPLVFRPDGELPPIPPVDLIQRVVPAFDSSAIDRARSTFTDAARGSVRNIERALCAVGRDLTQFGRVLDFGCGPGRIMRHLAPLAEQSELHGVDVDPDVIAWCAANIPYARFITGPHNPPLPYPDASFDLIFSHSVFTHIDEARQDQWLGELHRILSPGGIALLTVHSTRQWNNALGAIAEAGQDAEF